MKIENAKMRGFYTGLFAGFIGAIAVHISLMVSAMSGFHPDYAALLASERAIEFILYQLIYELGQVGISGAVFGIFYSMFYEAIPGKGVKKSFIFGLIILLFSNLWWSSYNFLLGLLTGIEKFFWYSILWTGAVYFWPVYGIFLGIFYERWK